jgi:xylulokinase
MSGDYLIGVDCSTTAAKAVVWSETGSAISEGRATFELSQPRPGWGEQNAEDWWVATAAAVRRAARPVDAARIRAICITHQRETFVCLDNAGRPLRPAMLWLDVRAVDEVERHGTPDVHRITGKPPNPTPAWYKLLWMAHHEPDIVRRIDRVVDVHALPGPSADRPVGDVVGQCRPAGSGQHVHPGLRRRAARGRKPQTRADERTSAAGFDPRYRHR